MTNRERERKRDTKEEREGKKKRERGIERSLFVINTLGEREQMTKLYRLVNLGI